MKPLNTVTDRFSLVDKIRKFTPQNARNYVFQAVKKTFNASETKERISLGEMYGYYGHGRRAMHYEKTHSLNLPEVSVVMVDGKPVVLDNVPSNRTLAVSIDDNGIISHTQEILDTEPGHIVQGMISSQAGGWSWATHGADGAVSQVKSFHGFDYVTVPNYISLDKRTPMLESADERHGAMYRALMESGYSVEGAKSLIAHFDSMQDADLMLESAARNSELEGRLLVAEAQAMELREKLADHTAMLESQVAQSKSCRRILRDALGEMPLFISREQQQALCRMEGKNDAMIVAAMLESIGTKAAQGLPIGHKVREELTLPRQADSNPLIFIPKV